MPIINPQLEQKNHHFARAIADQFSKENIELAFLIGIKQDDTVVITATREISPENAKLILNQIITGLNEGYEPKINKF